MDIKNISKDKIKEYIKNNNNIVKSTIIDELIIYDRNDILTELLENKIISLDYINSEGKTILYNIIKFNKKKILDIILEYNKKIIGINLINLLDSNNNNSLVYCIYYNNYDMFIKLIKIGFSPYNINKYNNNCFHIAVNLKNYKILSYLIENYNDFTFLNKENENYIYFLLSKKENQYIDIILERKDKNFLLNSQEKSYGLSIIILLVINNNINLLKKILKLEVNYNITDFFGNTILHYAILEKNLDVIEIVLKLERFNYNTQNIDGKTCIHLLTEEIEFFDILLEKGILKKILEKTNLNLQDNISESVLFSIIKNKRLDNIFDYIKDKNINPLLKNIYNNDIIDIINNDSKFMELLVEQYFKKLSKLDISNLQNKYDMYCKKSEFKKLDNIKEYKYVLKDTEDKNKCKKIILYNINKKIRYKPLKKIQKIKLDKGIYLQNCFYTGSIIDVLYCLIYIKINYNNCDILLESPLTKNNNMEKLYTKLNIDYPYRLDFCNFHIFWFSPNIIYPSYFENIKNLKRNYIIIPIEINANNLNHANIIFIDKNKKIIERFEPHGKMGNKSLYYNYKLLDRNLKSKFNILFPEFTYYSPDDYLETISFQTIENNMYNFCEIIGDPNGFCAIWCIWWVEQKLKYPFYDSKTLAFKLIKRMRQYNINFKEFIRNFSMKISSLRDEELKKHKIDINDWLNSNYDNNTLINIEKNILDIVN